MSSSNATDADYHKMGGGRSNGVCVISERFRMKTSAWCSGGRQCLSNVHMLTLTIQVAVPAGVTGQFFIQESSYLGSLLQSISGQ